MCFNIFKKMTYQKEQINELDNEEASLEFTNINGHNKKRKIEE